ncbi:MAG: hypothetical protein ACJ71F_08250, partial [Nitrososphaeraceae archaeon]
FHTHLAILSKYSLILSFALCLRSIWSFATVPFETCNIVAICLCEYPCEVNSSTLSRLNTIASSLNSRFDLSPNYNIK